MDRNQKAKEEFKKKKTDEAIEQMKNAPCTWPECKRKQFMTMSLPLMEQTQQGLVPAGMGDAKPGEMSVGIPTPFCDYHFSIAGLCAAIKDPQDSEKFMFYAPVDMVQCAEAVVSGMIFAGTLQEMLRGKEKAEKEVAEAMEGVNEDKTKDAEQVGDQPKDTSGDEQRAEVQQEQPKKEEEDGESSAPSK